VRDIFRCSWQVGRLSGITVHVTATGLHWKTRTIPGVPSLSSTVDIVQDVSYARSPTIAPAAVGASYDVIFWHSYGVDCTLNRFTLYEVYGDAPSR